MDDAVQAAVAELLVAELGLVDHLPSAGLADWLVAELAAAVQAAQTLPSAVAAG